MLVDMECDFLQGFYFSQPLSEIHIEHMLKQGFSLHADLSYPRREEKN